MFGAAERRVGRTGSSYLANRHAANEIGNWKTSWVGL